MYQGLSPQDEWDERTKDLWIQWRKLRGPTPLGSQTIPASGANEGAPARYQGVFNICIVMFIVLGLDGQYEHNNII